MFSVRPSPLISREPIGDLIDLIPDPAPSPPIFGADALSINLGAPATTGGTGSISRDDARTYAERFNSELTRFYERDIQPRVKFAPNTSPGGGTGYANDPVSQWIGTVYMPWHTDWSVFYHAQTEAGWITGPSPAEVYATTETYEKQYKDRRAELAAKLAGAGDTGKLETPEPSGNLKPPEGQSIVSQIPWNGVLVVGGIIGAAVGLNAIARLVRG